MQLFDGSYVVCLGAQKARREALIRQTQGLGLRLQLHPLVNLLLILVHKVIYPKERTEYFLYSVIPRRLNKVLGGVLLGAESVWLQ